jgi:hypothetical protein
MSAMDSRTRFIVFGVGACLGAFLLWFFNQHGKPAREHRKAIMTSLSLPGMYYDSAVQQKSLFGHFILAERRQPRADGTLAREMITGGRNRFAEDGRALANDLILVTEIYAAGVTPSEDAKVSEVSFAYADRAQITFREIPESWKWHSRFTYKKDATNPLHFQVSLSGVTSLKGEELFLLVDHIKSSQSNRSITLAQLGLIDWKAEADLIRKESGQ